MLEMRCFSAGFSRFGSCHAMMGMNTLREAKRRKHASRSGLETPEWQPLRLTHTYLESWMPCYMFRFMIREGIGGWREGQQPLL